MKKNIVKGSILILLGACCYGLLAINVKMAYADGYSTAEVTISQFGIGCFVLLLLNIFKKATDKKDSVRVSAQSTFKLMLAGTSMGLTSVFYYMAVKYIPVSIAIVLLMQAVWMGVLLEMIVTKKFCGWHKVFSVLVIVIGSIFATNVLEESMVIQWNGIGWGMLAAASYAATMYSTKNIEAQLPALVRSLYLILGGLLIILLIFHSAINLHFSYPIFYTWGLIIALFGTILPPLLFTAGMPLTGVGLGAILASIEVPVAIIGAHFVLQEHISMLQWLGIVLILVSVVIMNFEKNRTAYS
jgi:drug/metabolite transporter (DMT)-like permease